MEAFIVIIGLVVVVIVGLLISWVRSKEPSNEEEDYESKVYWKKQYKEWKDW